MSEDNTIHPKLTEKVDDIVGHFGHDATIAAVLSASHPISLAINDLTKELKRIRILLEEVE